MNLKYYADIKDVENNSIRVEIYVREDVNKTKEITIAKEGIKISRECDDDILYPIVNSKATIEVISENDREFLSMYRVGYKEAQLVIRKNDNLYWTGSLDPEMYSEPFDKESVYLCTLSFSDLSVLKRVKWTKAGLMSIENIIKQCCEFAIEPSIVSVPIERNTSTSLYRLIARVPDFIPYSRATLPKRMDDPFWGDKLFAGTKVDAIKYAYIDCSLFIDEKDEKGNKSYFEVLEAILEPFTCRIEQRGGRFYVYDLHSIASSKDWIRLTPRNANQTLGVDKVYNSIELEIDPIDVEEIYETDIKIKGERTSCDIVRVDTHPEHVPDFTLEIGNIIKSGKPIPNGNSAMTFKVKGSNGEKGKLLEYWRLKYEYDFITSDNGTPKSAGAINPEPVYFWLDEHFYKYKNTFDKWKNTTSKGSVYSEIITLPTCTPDILHNYKIGLSMDLLLSYSYNYLHPKDLNSNHYRIVVEGKEFDLSDVRRNYVMLPSSVGILATIYAIKDKKRVAKLTNMTLDQNAGEDNILFAYAWFSYYLPAPRWVDVNAKNEAVVLSYGDGENAFKVDSWNQIKMSSGFVNKDMRQEYGYNYDGVAESIFAFPIPLGADSIEVNIHNVLFLGETRDEYNKRGARVRKMEANNGVKRALIVASVSNGFDNGRFSYLSENIFRPQPNWVLAKDLVVKLVRYDGQITSGDTYKLVATLDKRAEEEANKSIMLTSSRYVSPLAKGNLRDLGGGLLYSFERGGQQSTIEELYVNTFFSHYANRRMCYNGTYKSIYKFSAVRPQKAKRDLVEDVFIEKQGKLDKYIITEEEENTLMCISDLRIQQVVPDEYAPEVIMEDDED